MIQITIDKPIRCNGQASLFISFPYDTNIINIMRNQIIRYWLPQQKLWEIPYNNFKKVYKELSSYTDDIKVIYNIEMQPEPTVNLSQYKFKQKPFKHQLEGIEYGLKYDRFLLGDEQGLGKTMQAISIACIKKQQRNYKHCFIICGVNGLKWNWIEEIQKHSNEQGYILGTRYDKSGKEKIGSLKDRLEDLENIENIKQYFIVTNIETLRDENIIKKLKDLCDNNIINMIVLDERT